MGADVSVLLTVRNVDKYIGLCIASLISQTFRNYEIILVDDLSIDKTQEIIEKFKDERIRYFKNEKSLGLSASRNKCLELATGHYVFFIDGDCIASRNWIEEGMKCLKSSDLIGLEGRTYYVSEEYEPTRSDDIVDNKSGGQYPTCNMAYKKSVLTNIGGFDERYTYMEDKDLALRAKKFGKIPFYPNMIVYHQKKTLDWRGFMRKAPIIRNRVLIYKKFHDKTFFAWKILYPLRIAAILFPPLIINSFISSRYKTNDDFALFPFTYPRLIIQRLLFWDMCAREKVLLL